MSQASTTRRARLDALLDQGGLDQASAADREWLAAERARDASFDHEVAALLRAEGHLREWGTRMAGAGQSSDDALLGILAGLDAGLYDDDLEVDGPPRFADGEGEVVGLAAARPVAVAPDAVAASAAPQPRTLASRLHNGRLMQVLAAAAALVLVVTAGLSMVSVSSAPNASESEVALEAPAPAQAPSPAAAVAPVPVAPAEATPLAEAEFADDQRGLWQANAQAAAPAAPTDGLGMIGGGYGGEGDSSGTSARRPSGTAASVGSGGAPPEAQPRSQTATEAVELLATAPQGPPPVVRPTFAAEAPTAVDDAATRGASRQPGASRPTSAVTQAPRYTTQSAMQQAMAPCITAQRVVTYQVASGTGLVQVLSAPGATDAELSCLHGVAARTTVTPAPGVARRQQVTLRPVSDRSAR